MEENNQEIFLHVDGQVFATKKDVLCEHSDYFRAMFSGRYIEKQKTDVTIDVVDADSMNILLRYMKKGHIDLSKYRHSKIGNLAMAANFLQITELIKQIEYCLDLQLSVDNWVDTMAIAENTSYTNLEKRSAACGLLSFKSMKVNHIPTIHKLCWYLSHPHINAANELEVFTFGFKWLSDQEMGGDALLIILGCLDFKKVSLCDLNGIKQLLNDTNSLAEKIIDCLLVILGKNNEISEKIFLTDKQTLCETFTERVYSETLSLIRESKERKLELVPCIPMWNRREANAEMFPRMFTFSPKEGFKKWLAVADTCLWGWNVTNWGPDKMVVVGGEHGRGTGTFMRDVKVYDTLRNKWIEHGVQLPPRRHGSSTIVGDSLFIVGGVGGYRVVLDSVIVYNMKHKIYRKIAKLPDAIQNPGICAHNGTVYAAGQTNIYKYQNLERTDNWILSVNTEIRINNMASFKEYIYCTQNYFSHFYRFKPDVENRLELIHNFSFPPSTICNIGDRLIIFTQTLCGQFDKIAAEEFTGDGTFKRVWTGNDCPLKVYEVAGSCTVVRQVPPLCQEFSQYHQKYLKMFSDSTSGENKL